MNLNLTLYPRLYLDEHLKANHWGWAMPGVCYVSLELASLSSLLSASPRVSSKDRIEPSTCEHDQSFGSLRRRWAEVASLQLYFSHWLSSWNSGCISCLHPPLSHVLIPTKLPLIWSWDIVSPLRSLKQNSVLQEHWTTEDGVIRAAWMNTVK